MTEQRRFAVARLPAARAQRDTGSRTSSYSRAAIVSAIRRWVNLYGEVPRTIDWEPSRARRLGQEWRAQRFEGGAWPSVRVVCKQFTSFNSAIEAAGLTPRLAPERQRPNLAGPHAVIEAMLAWTRRYGDMPTLGSRTRSPARPRLADRALLPGRLAQRAVGCVAFWFVRKRRLGRWAGPHVNADRITIDAKPSRASIGSRRHVLQGPPGARDSPTSPPASPLWRKHGRARILSPCTPR